MKFLIVEDDFISRKILQDNLRGYADCHAAVNGKEALEAFHCALDEGKPYDLVFLDIMMPEMDGRTALRKIRELEAEHGIRGLDCAKVIMTTALDDNKNILGSFTDGCECYLTKPINRKKLFETIEGLLAPSKG